MVAPESKAQASPSATFSSVASQSSTESEHLHTFTDQRPETTLQRKHIGIINESPQVNQGQERNRHIRHSPVMQRREKETAQRFNLSGLKIDTPDSAPEKAAIETGKTLGTASANEAGSTSKKSLGNSTLHRSVRQFEGSGQALPSEIRQPAEHKLGIDLSTVRVHTDSKAQQLSHTIQAKAVTSGNHIFFGQGKYQPQNTQGRELIGHELTHVAQQQGRTGLLQRATDMDKLRTTPALQEFQFEAEGTRSIKELIDRKDTQKGGVRRDANYNNLIKRSFEEDLAVFVFRHWDLVAPVVLKVSQGVKKYVNEKEKIKVRIGEGHGKMDSVNKMRENENTLGYPGFVPNSPEEADAIFDDQTKVSLPTHLNIHGKFSYAMFNEDHRTGVAAQAGYPHNSLDRLMPEELFKASDHEDNPDLGRPRIAIPREKDSDARAKKRDLRGLSPYSEPQSLNVPEIIRGRPTNSDQEHNRGGDFFYLDESKRWTQEARLLYDMPVMAGPSGSAAYMLNTAMVMGLDTEELRLYTMALIGSIVGGGHHTFHEIMTVAQLVGVPYTPGNYLSAIPPEFMENEDFLLLLNHYFEPVSNFSQRTRSDESTPAPEVGHALNFGLPPIKNEMGALKQHIGTQLGIENWTDLDIRKVNEEGLDTKGVSGAIVYMVYYEAQKLGVVKVFMDFGEMAQEMSAMQKINELELPGFEAPKIQTVGKITGFLKDYGLIMSTIAPGVELGDLMTNTGQLPEGSARNRAFRELEDAVYTVGTKLSSLHGSTPGEKVSDSFIEAHVQKVSAYAQQAFENPDAGRLGIKSFDFIGIVRTVIRQFEAHPGPASVIHGDAHPGNFFVNNQTVSAIDTPTMDTSIGKGGKGVGSPARDTANFMQKLYSVGKSAGLTVAETNRLETVFAHAYKSNRDAPEFSRHAFVFFSLRTFLSELKNALTNKQDQLILELINDIKDIASLL